MEIRQARSDQDLDRVRALFRAYQRDLGVDLGFQHFEAELAGLPGGYAPPGGGLVIAVEGGLAQGCVALRGREPGVCEMKRLYVRPEARGAGLGRVLAEEIIRLACARGYRTMCLDTLDRLHQAMGLYPRLGFTRAAPYYENPLPGVVWWELRLPGSRV